MFQCIPIIDFSTLSRHWSLSLDYTHIKKNPTITRCQVSRRITHKKPDTNYAYLLLYLCYGAQFFTQCSINTITYLLAWRCALFTSRGSPSIDIRPNSPLQGTIPSKLCYYYLWFIAIFQAYHGVTIQLNNKLLVEVLEEINLKKHER